MIDYYAVKVMHPAEAIEIADRIEWCVENEIKFFNSSIMGCRIAGKFYTAEEMLKIGVLRLSNAIGEAEIDLSTLPPKNIGMAFVFHAEEDAVAFKLRWI